MADALRTTRSIVHCHRHVVGRGAEGTGDEGGGRGGGGGGKGGKGRKVISGLVGLRDGRIALMFQRAGLAGS
jgi:hypothetical protein